VGAADHCRVQTGGASAAFAHPTAAPAAQRLPWEPKKNNREFSGVFGVFHPSSSFSFNGLHHNSLLLNNRE
jgi:hypothetical protein